MKGKNKNKGKTTNIVISLMVLISIITFSCTTKIQKTTAGLIGIYYSEADLTSIKGISVLTSLNQKWDDSIDYQGDTSGEWDGYLVAPVDGEVDFYLATNRTLHIKVGNTDEAASTSETFEKKTTLKMEQGKSYPINIVFYNPGEHEDVGWFNIEWSWEGQEKMPIQLSNMYHTEKESVKLDFLAGTEVDNRDKSEFIIADVENTTVYYESGRYGAWPANNGIWSWGNEILVGFTQAYYKENKYHHAIDRHRPVSNVLARSTDGGRTWKLGDTTTFDRSAKELGLNETKINFLADGFALRNKQNEFSFSYDRGNTWKGPFMFPDLGTGKLTSRTDYLVGNQDANLIFTSAKDGKVQAALQDRAMTIKTTDGGVNFEFVSWMTEEDSIRSVMPATVRIDENHLVSALRRRLDPPKGVKYALPKNWIDVYESLDNGTSWKFLHKIANTDTGIRNGNPPSMVKLKNGLLCVIYGYRGFPYGIRAKVSSDQGKSWSKEIILRDDAASWDLGYVRSVVNAADQVVSVYYYSTREHPERHIQATIWDPKATLRTTSKNHD